jgi:hypothetical protein
MRLLSLLLLLAVLPTVELAEQTLHAIEHAHHAEVPDHSAHHDEEPGDEHGCTGLMHLCSCHHTQVTITLPGLAAVTTEIPDTLTIEVPPPLIDLTSVEPPKRPPIG